MLEQFIRSNLKAAIATQGRFANDHEMVAAIKKQKLNIEMVRNWMQSYRLLQGVEGKTRDKLARVYIEFAYANHNFLEEEIKDKFKNLHNELQGVMEKKRKWLSATSKLLSTKTKLLCH